MTTINSPPALARTSNILRCIISLLHISPLCSVDQQPVDEIGANVTISGDLRPYRRERCSRHTQNMAPVTTGLACIQFPRRTERERRLDRRTPTPGRRTQHCSDEVEPTFSHDLSQHSMKQVERSTP